ncbi:hypothetical protein ACFY94_26015 [Streptomyces griseorubiginosus]
MTVRTAPESGPGTGTPSAGTVGVKAVPRPLGIRINTLLAESQSPRAQ